MKTKFACLTLSLLLAAGVQASEPATGWSFLFPENTPGVDDTYLYTPMQPGLLLEQPASTVVESLPGRI